MSNIVDKLKELQKSKLINKDDFMKLSDEKKWALVATLTAVNDLLKLKMLKLENKQ